MSGAFGGQNLPLQPLTGRGILRLVSPGAVTQRLEEESQARDAVEKLAAAARLAPDVHTNLSAHIMRLFDMMVRHRQSGSGWEERMNRALRMFKGEYGSQTLQDIRRVGGSEIYARVVSVKCRGATSLLRDVYLSGQRPWEVEATPDPRLPDAIAEDIDQIVRTEAQAYLLAQVAQQQGQPEIPGVPGINPGGAQMQPMPEQDMIRRREQLMNLARDAARKKARDEAKKMTRRLDDILTEGGFYKALTEVLIDLPLFPFACIKGPVVKVVPTVKWENGKAAMREVPRMFWERVNPFDLWWTPGAPDIAVADIIEKVRFTRGEINAMLGLPGYDDKAIRELLRDYGSGGYTLASAYSDDERASLESRESPSQNESGLIEGLLFTGSVQGAMLREYGWSAKKVPDVDRDYAIQAWLVGGKIIKVQLSPSLTKRHPYFVTSFEKVPGTIVGNAIPDILADIQDVCNAALRALNNNMALSSGPQIVVNEDMLSPGENPDEFFPWKRWRVTLPQNGIGNAQNQRPIDFFQPNSNVQQLLGVYEKFTQIADELSAIPRYITGSERMGGAGRTASGLAMLMNNASKILQTVTSNVDLEIFEPALRVLHELVLMTDTEGLFKGDEEIRVRGVAVALQRETERQRQIEMLQATANPIDMQILGLRGRAALLRSVSEALGLDGELIVPPEDEIVRREQQMQNAPPGAPPGGQPEDPANRVSERDAVDIMASNAQGARAPGPALPQGPRTSIAA